MTICPYSKVEWSTQKSTIREAKVHRKLLSLAKKGYCGGGAVVAAKRKNKAHLVIIGHGVAAIELVVWLPALCRNMEIPCCIIEGKS
ncbi:60S ribosomal protein L7a-2 [Tanacetum coccineum]